jgi:hypothetical protein
MRKRASLALKTTISPASLAWAVKHQPELAGLSAKRGTRVDRRIFKGLKIRMYGKCPARLNI